SSDYPDASGDAKPVSVEFVGGPLCSAGWQGCVGCLESFPATGSGAAQASWLENSLPKQNDSRQSCAHKKTRFRGLFRLSRGAQERTRTSTELPPLAPEASASTNSATWATQG